jgi:myo-inositol 2-dehydrogenase/D-chiro-inositol 1-dehydrogenase
MTFADLVQIDAGRYFLDVTSGIPNPKKQVNRVIAMGQQAVYGDLAQHGDCDNGWGMVEFANGGILTTHLGRTLTNGYEATTRLCGTKGHSLINSDCRINGVEIRDAYGVRTLTTPDAFVLHSRSFLNDLAEFAAAVLDGAPLTCAPEDAYEAAKIGTALQYSFRTGLPVYFDDNGMPILEAKIPSVLANGTVAATNGVHPLKIAKAVNGVNAVSASNGFNGTTNGVIATNGH